jgi:protein-L-isoaspartate(D-aspartate) O-methyltransferase
MYTGPSQAGLVHHLLQTGMLQQGTLATAAMLQVDRGHYAPYGNPYEDSPQGIGFGQTISAPHMHAQALSLLEPSIIAAARGKGRVRILDVGCGSGYLTAALARLAEKAGAHDVKVVGVESIRELVALSIMNIRNSDPDLLDKNIVEVHLQDGWKGYHKDIAPYDAIHVGAAADRMPDALREQLSMEGKMVIPIGDVGFDQNLYLCEKDKHGELHCEPIEPVVFVPLIKNPLGPP